MAKLSRDTNAVLFVAFVEPSAWSSAVDLVATLIVGKNCEC